MLEFEVFLMQTITIIIPITSKNDTDPAVPEAILIAGLESLTSNLGSITVDSVQVIILCYIHAYFQI